MLTQVIQERIASSLRPAIGQTLKRVIYRCLNWECTYEEVEGPLFAMGGEVELRFENDAVIFVSWSSDRSIDWQVDYHVDFFIQVSIWEPFFLAGGIEPFDATKTPLWRPLVGTKLEKVEVLGWDSVPCVLKFHFAGVWFT